MLLSPTVNDLDYQSLLNTEEALTQGLVYWHLALPGRHGGDRAYDLTKGLLSTRAGMASPPTATSGPGTTARPGGWGEERFAGAFTGSNDAIVLPAINLSNVHTIAFWVKHIAFNGIVVAGATGYFIGYVDVSGNIYYSSAGTNISWTSGIVLGAWSHVAFVRNGTSVTYYRDGRQVGSTLGLANNNSFTVAQLGDYAAPAFPLNGALDNVQFYLNTRLSATQVYDLYTDGRTFHPRMLRRVGIPLPSAPAVSDVHMTIALVAEDATLAMELHTEAHLTIALVAEDATLAMVLSTSVNMTIALVAEDATLAMAMHQPALAASLTWLAAAANAATLAAQTGAYQPVLLVDFPDFTRTFSTHPPLFGAEEPRLARLAEGGVGAVSRDLDELDGGVRLGGSSVALVSDAGFIETFTNGPLLNTPVHLRLGFVGLLEPKYLRIWTGVLDRYQFTHQRLEFALIDSSVKDSINLDVPIGADLFPNAPSESHGKNIPIFIGVHTAAPTIQVSGVEATGALSFPMDAVSTTVVLLEDTASFPAASTVTVGAESLSYTARQLINIGGRTYAELSGLTRGAPVTHSPGAVVTLTDLLPSYVTGFGVERVNAVRANGIPMAAEDVSVSLLQLEWGSVPVLNLLELPAEDAVITVDVNADSPLLGLVPPPVEDPPAEGNIVTNGDFAAGVTGWTAEVTAVIWAAGTGGTGELRGTATVYGGAYVMLTTVAGVYYQYSVAYRNPHNPTMVDDQARGVIGIQNFTGPGRQILVEALLPVPSNIAATTATGVFQALGETTRLNLGSKYTVTAYSTFFDDVSVAPTFELPEVPGTVLLANEDGENPVDVILYLLALYYHTATYNAQAFALARVQLDTMRFRGLLTNPGDSGTLLQRAGAQCKSLVQRNALGEYTITVLDDTRPTAMAFTTANLVIESFQRASVPIDSVFTSFYVYFDTDVGGSTSPGDYAGVAYCTSTATTATDGEALIALCLQARTFYGRDHRDECYADFVKDIDTAHQLLAWRVGRYAIRQDSLTWRAWLDAVPLELGQVVSLQHPVLANADAVILTELTNWHYQPGDHHVTLTTRTLGATLDVGLTTPGAPVAYPDVGVTSVNTPVVLEILANDVPGLGGVLNPFTIDLDPATGGRQTTFTDPGKAVFVVDAYGVVTITPVTDYVGPAVAAYTVADQFGSVSNSTTITLSMESHMTIALIAEDAILAMEMHLEGGEEELAQACNFVFINEIDDPSVDVGNDTGIHIINAFCLFPEESTAMACSGDPSMVGGTGAVSGPGFNDVYTSSRLGVASMNPYTSFLGTIDVTSSGHGVTAMVAMAAYDGLLYVAVNTSLDSDQEVNGPPAIFTVANITDLEEDSYYDTWVEAQEFATTFSRVGAMAEHNGALYAALEPKLPGTNTLAIWQFDGVTWSLQHNFGTSFSRLRSFFGVGAKLYAGVDGQLWYATAGTWAHAQTFTGAVDSLSYKDGLIYVNVRNGSNREIWRGSSDDNVFTLHHTFTGETGTLVGPMATALPHPDEVEGWLYVPVHEADGTKVYRWDGIEWTMDNNYGTDFLGVSAMALIATTLFLALPRRLHTSDPGGGNIPGCEIWAVQCYYPPDWDLTYDVAIVDFTSLITDEVIPFPPDATWDVATLSLDSLVFPELDLTIEVGLDGVLTGTRTDTSYGGPYTTTYRCDDSLGRHWAGTFSITFTAG